VWPLIAFVFWFQIPLSPSQLHYCFGSADSSRVNLLSAGSDNILKMSTAEKSYMGLRGRPLSMAVSVVATTGFLLFGYDQGVMSGIISAKPFNTYFPDTAGDDEQASIYRGFVTAIYEVGCLLGAAFILWCGDSLGRRRSVSTPFLLPLFNSD
jgi:hypothetical protein